MAEYEETVGFLLELFRLAMGGGRPELAFPEYVSEACEAFRRRRYHSGFLHKALALPLRLGEGGRQCPTVPNLDIGRRIMRFLLPRPGCAETRTCLAWALGGN